MESTGLQFHFNTSKIYQMKRKDAFCVVLSVTFLTQGQVAPGLKISLILINVLPITKNWAGFSIFKLMSQSHTIFS